MAFDKGIDLGLNGLHQHPTRTLTQKAKQRIIFDNTAWSRQTDNGIFSHGVSFQKVISSITKDTPPKPSSTKFSYSPAVTATLPWIWSGSGHVITRAVRRVGSSIGKPTFRGPHDCLRPFLPARLRRNSRLFQAPDGIATCRTYHLYEVKKKNAGGAWQVFRRTRWQ